MSQPKFDSPLKAAHWSRRLFKNTYTRGGRRFKVKSWSVKIQHEGHRKTFTFPGIKKDAAAGKALAIYRVVREKGWAGLTRSPPGSAASKFKSLPSAVISETLKTDSSFWQARLSTRKYPPNLEPGNTPVLSANIAREGREVWFPLGTSVEAAAAAKALEIYLTVARKGWPAAFRKFSREVSLAVHWTLNPLAWTYTTFHTFTSGFQPPLQPSKSSRKSGAKLNVALIEPEECLRLALAHWIDMQPETLCVAAYSDPREALRDTIPPKQTLWLVNRDLPVMTGQECLEKLQLTMPDFCGLVYSTYDDSEHLFAASAGGSRGYLFKRTLPDQILHPLTGIATEGTLSMNNIRQRVRQYFQQVISLVLPDDTMRRLETLTQREHEILQALGKGYLDKEIADKLGISAWTVRGHVKKIFRKLQVHTRTEAVIQYLQR